MITRIAVIGSAEFINDIQAIASKVANLNIQSYIYQHPQESADLLTKLLPCDAVFFSGALPYYFSKSEREKLPIPAVYLAQDEYTISATFLSILSHMQIPLNRISIDLMDAAIIYNIAETTKIELSENHIIDYKKMLETHDFNLEKLVTFHQLLWEKKAIDLALTSVHAIYDQLVHLGIPAMRMTDPPNALLKGLEAAKTMAEYAKSQSAQVAVAYISLQTDSTEIHNDIHSLANKLHATAQQVEQQSYVIINTRGNIEALANEGHLQAFFTKYPTSIAIGFGYGATVKEAEENAKIALKFAEKDFHASSGFTLTDKKELKRLLAQPNQHRLINDHPEIFKMAKKTKLSPANLSKIIEFAKARVAQPFSSADLAEYLQVTRRTAERMMKKLADHHYVEVVGEEMLYQQGRPRALYSLNIPIYF